MSFKKKLVTAVTTAGLLAGIFGSAFAPVAQAATTTVDYAQIQAEFRGNLIDDWQDIQDAPNDGSTATPGIIYAPWYNTGLTDGSEVEQAACTYVDADDIETLAGEDLLNSDDVSASITVTGALLVEGDDDDATFAESSDEDDFGTTYTDNNVTTGVAACFTANDDDASSKSETATLKINGVTAAVLYFRIVGPGKTITLTDNTGGWVAMDNEEVEEAFTIAFLDAAGNNLFTSLRDSSSDTSDGEDTEAAIEDYWLDGYEAEGSNLEYIQDIASTGDSFNVYGSLEVGANDGRDYARIDLAGGAPLCDSSRDADFGMSHNVWAVMDLGSGGTVSSLDTKSNPVTVKCSAWGDEALVTGIDFGTATQVELGGVVPLYMRIQDGYGNPLGVGTTDSLDFGFYDFQDCDVYDFVDDDCFTLVPSPLHIQVDGDDPTFAALDAMGASTEVEDIDDGDTVCNGSRGSEANYTLEGDDSLDDELNVAGSDKFAAGVVLLCYYASNKTADLGRNVIRANMDYPYTDTLANTYGAGNSPVTYSASITLVRETGAAAGNAFGSSVVKAGKRTVSVTGPIGAKITFVVENANGGTKSYNRVVNATTGKATLKIKKNGRFDVYAMYGDSITGLLRIVIK